jgi:hypothetical protein
MKFLFLASVLSAMTFLTSGCTERTVVYRTQRTYVHSSGDSGPPRTTPGMPIRARDGAAPQNFDAQGQ